MFRLKCMYITLTKKKMYVYYNLQFIKTNGVFGSDGNRSWREAMRKRKLHSIALNLVRVDEFARVDVNLR